MEIDAKLEQKKFVSPVELEDESSTQDEPGGKYDNDSEKILENASLRVLYQTNNILLPQIVNMIRDEKVVEIEPEYQRRIRWNNKQQSRLIESLILNVPIPPIYWYETDSAEYEVMDGQQRLTAIVDFFENKLKLTDLSYRKSLNGKYYEDLDKKVKSTINRASINTVVLLMENVETEHMENKFDLRRLIFERLNTGGTKLNSQEIRNALYPTPLNKAIIELSRHKNFVDAFGFVPYTSDDPKKCKNAEIRKENTDYKTMKDCEIVLRFFALKKRSNIRGGLVSILDRALIESPSESEIEDEKNLFISCFDFLYELFDQKPFRINVESEYKPKVSTNLYDALMVAIYELWEHRDEIINDKAGIQSRLSKALKKNEDYLLLTGKKSGAKSILKKIDLAKSILYKGERK